MPSLLLALLLAGCTPSTPEPANNKAPQAMDARAKAAKVKAMKAAKAKMMKAKMMKAKATRARTVDGGGAPQGRIGAEGEMLGQLVLTPTGEGDAMKTRAQLRMGWEGGQHTAFLGVTAGSCEEVEPKEVASGLTATWWSTCTWKDMTADFAILSSGGMLLVQRAITRGGEQGEWATVRRIPLAEGAVISKGEVAEAKAPAGGDAPAPVPAAAPDPAPAPEAPAPAPPDAPE